MVSVPAEKQGARAVWDKTKAALLRGDTVLGHFAPADASYEVAGGVHWSTDDGVCLELAEVAPDWPQALRGDSYTVHGRTRDGDELTLLNARTTRVSLGNQVSTVRSTTLALGEFTSPEDTWSRAIYSTTNQGEWRSDAGLHYERPEPRLWEKITRSKPRAALRVEVRRPTRDDLTVPGANLAFDGESPATVTVGPEWSIRTRQVLVVNPVEALTAAALRRRYADPLLALMTFAADRPDSISHEILLNPASRRRIEVWRAGPRIEPHEWRPGNGFLFHAHDVANYPEAIQRWWELYEAVWPALGVFADHIGQGNTYGPTRLITLYSALEAYARARHQTTDFKELRTYAGVPSDVTGCTNQALTLLGASRGYFAHLSEPPAKYSRDDFDENALLSTRRGHSLMQGCLLRELGFDATDATRLLREHQAHWPLQ